MVCAEFTTGKEMFLGTPDGPPSSEGQMEARFGPFGDSVYRGAGLVHGLHRMLLVFLTHIDKSVSARIPL
jgi:hypothetical protein